MAKAAIKEILRLPLSERMEATEAIWNSLVDTAEAQALVEPTDQQRAELRRRIDELTLFAGGYHYPWLHERVAGHP